MQPLLWDIIQLVLIVLGYVYKLQRIFLLQKFLSQRFTGEDDMVIQKYVQNMKDKRNCYENFGAET